MTDISKNDFNYASVDAETAAKLEYYATSLKSLVRKSQIEFIAKCGEILSDARKLLANNKNGTFIKWATAEFDLSARTVWNYVNSWDKILCNGCTTYLHWTPTALYLASDEDITKAIQKKLEKLPQTDLVRASDVKRLIDASKPKPDPEDEDPFGDDSEDAPALTPAQQKKADAEAAKLKKTQEAEAAKAKKKADAEAAKAKKKEEAAAERERKKQEAANAKMASLSNDEQVKAIKHMFQQHIDKAVRLLDDLHEVKPNNAARTTSIKTLQGVKPW